MASSDKRHETVRSDLSDLPRMTPPTPPRKADLLVKRERSFRIHPVTWSFVTVWTLLHVLVAIVLPLSLGAPVDPINVGVAIGNAVISFVIALGVAAIVWRLSTSQRYLNLNITIVAVMVMTSGCLLAFRVLSVASQNGAGP